MFVILHVQSQFYRETPKIYYCKYNSPTSYTLHVLRPVVTVLGPISIKIFERECNASWSVFDGYATRDLCVPSPILSKRLAQVNLRCKGISIPYTGSNLKHARLTARPCVLLCGGSFFNHMWFILFLYLTFIKTSFPAVSSHEVANCLQKSPRHQKNHANCFVSFAELFRQHASCLG